MFYNIKEEDAEVYEFFLFLLPFICSAALAAKQPQPQPSTKSQSSKAVTIKKRVDSALTAVKTDKTSALAQRISKTLQIYKDNYGLSYYEPTYILPFYYTQSVSPYYANYPGSTPEHMTVRPLEFKAQLSFLFPLWVDIFGSGWVLNAAYTQLMYWQLYTKSPYFRETNYEPRVFFSNEFHKNWLFALGIVHQSNGRGGAGPSGMERSWNRIYSDLAFSRENWVVILEPWVPIFKADSQDLHNSDIERYLGYGRVILAYKIRNQELSFIFRNILASGFHRGTVEVDYSFPLSVHVNAFVQVFSGYGQSLIEYNHYTNAVGVGISLTNWI